MDEHLDTSWCPGCDRMVLPKRYTVVVPDPLRQPQGSAVAAPPPPALQVRQPQRGKRASRGGALGLVHGTGRVKLGGGIRSESDELDTSKRTTGPTTHSDAPPAPPPPSPSSPRSAALPNRVRTVISQEQTPLYCSEACRLRDAQHRESRPPRIALKAAPSPAAVSCSQTSSLEDMFAVPAARRPSDSSNSTDVSSLFDHSQSRHLPDVVEDEIPSPSGHSKGLPSNTGKAAYFGAGLCPPGDQKSTSAPHGRSTASTRSHETGWRRSVYGIGHSSASARRSRSATPAPADSRPIVDIRTLSPFDRIRSEPAPTASAQHAHAELLSKLQFARNPSSSALSSRSSLVHPRGSTSSVCSTQPPPSLSRSNSNSGTGTTESGCDDDLSDSDSEPPVQPRSLTPSCGYLSLSTTPEKRDDPLGRAMAAKFKAERRRQQEARRVEERERELEEARALRERGDEPETWQDQVKRLGPIMGRRAAGMSSAPDGHSWSYEQLPAHIPLYPMPGPPPRRVKEKRVQRVQDEHGVSRDVEIEVEVFEQPKRLFIFGGSSRRQSTLSVSCAYS